jgi:hypothetical protein
VEAADFSKALVTTQLGCLSERFTTVRILNPIHFRIICVYSNLLQFFPVCVCVCVYARAREPKIHYVLPLLALSVRSPRASSKSKAQVNSSVTLCGSVRKYDIARNINIVRY